MKLCWIVFHKNHKQYPKEWIDDFRNSVLNNDKIPIYEINYGNKKDRIFPHSNFFKGTFKTHSEAHNWILDRVFADGYDWAFNTNIDDCYANNRVSVQSKYFEGSDLVTCNMSHIDKDNYIVRADINFAGMDIKEHFNRNPPHNVIAHPGVCYSKEFWTNCPKLNPEWIPSKEHDKSDDFELWKWGIANGYRFTIVPETLLYYRIHDNNISGVNRKNKLNPRFDATRY